VVSFIFRPHYSLPKNASYILHKRIRGQERRSRCGAQYRPYPCRKKDAVSWIRSQSPGKPQKQACGILKYPVARQNVCCGFRQCIAGLHLKTASQKTQTPIICRKHVAAYVFCCYLEKCFKEQQENPSWFPERYHLLCTTSVESILQRKCKFYFRFTKCIKI
jgi:hypothetical protein